jgi:hypothetical protein
MKRKIDKKASEGILKEFQSHEMAKYLKNLSWKLIWKIITWSLRSSWLVRRTLATTARGGSGLTSRCRGLSLEAESLTTRAPGSRRLGRMSKLTRGWIRDGSLVVAQTSSMDLLMDDAEVISIVSASPLVGKWDERPWKTKEKE